MKRIFITVEYNGKNYLGWQKNGDEKTICKELESAFNRATGVDIRITASGRTDSGVHALCQACHLDIENCDIKNIKKVIRKVNDILPCDIAVTSAKEVSEKFHARYNVRSKTYLYKCYTSMVRSPLKDEFYAHYPAVLNIEKIKSAAKLFVGKHDFKAFCLSGGDNDDFVREIISIDIVRRGEELLFYVKGKGFLYGMVRIIVGTLLKVGENKITENDIIFALSSGEKQKIGEKMPAHGLCLYNVEY